jgi:hypothetical protein
MAASLENLPQLTGHEARLLKLRTFPDDAQMVLAAGMREYRQLDEQLALGEVC